MILSDQKIYDEVNNGNITIEPFNEDQLNPNSYDVRLDDVLKYYGKNNVYKPNDIIDLKEESNNTSEIKINKNGTKLKNKILYLGSTVEKVGSNEYVPILEGKSSLARSGVTIHQTGGFGDLGFIGHWTLEISCIHPVVMYPNIPIGQICFMEAHEAKELYSEKSNSKYINQSDEPVESKYHQNFEG